VQRKGNTAVSEKQKTVHQNRRRGFIVAELIVVIIIVALLLGILIPPVVRFIRSAEADYEIAEARTAVTALQVINTITYERADIEENDPGIYDRANANNITLTEQGQKELEGLASTKLGKVDQILFEGNGQLKSLRYFTLDGSVVDYDSSQYSVDLA
jgi:type II secretory pathway pseudopilin PulG